MVNIDALIDWLHAMAEQHKSDIIRLDGCTSTVEKIAVDAIEWLEKLIN